MKAEDQPELLAATETEPCARCGRAVSICVCDDSPRLSIRRRVLVLQHPREQDVEFGSAKLAAAMLDNCELKIGLSWASLAKVLGRAVDPAAWAVVYPGGAKEALPGVVVDKKGRRVPPRKIEGLVLLDGSWGQARSLWWRNPWLLKLNRLALAPREPSIYGSLRPEPRREYVSTLEALGCALTVLGEALEVEASLRRSFRRLVQRARDERGGEGEGGRASRLKRRRKARQRG